MTTYLSSKKVTATPMNRADYNSYRGWELPANEDGADEGYLVEYLDGGKPNHPDHKGYISWSPKEQFDAGYADITDGFDFGEAIKKAKLGCKVARKGWNGSGMYAALMPGFPEGVPANKQTAELHGIEIGAMVKIRPYWVLKTAQNDIAMWSPSGSDSLAEDWIVEEQP